MQRIISRGVLRRTCNGKIKALYLLTYKILPTNKGLGEARTKSHNSSSIRRPKSRCPNPEPFPRSGRVRGWKTHVPLPPSRARPRNFLEIIRLRIRMPTGAWLEQSWWEVVSRMCLTSTALMVFVWCLRVSGLVAAPSLPSFSSHLTLCCNGFLSPFLVP